MFVGGGEVGESAVSTARTDIVDLDASDSPGAGRDRPARPARYLSTVLLPDDTVLTTGGSSGYRGAGAARSDLFNAQIYAPPTDRSTWPRRPVGRNYHSRRCCCRTAGSSRWAATRSTTGHTNPGTFEHADRDLHPAVPAHRDRASGDHGGHTDADNTGVVRRGSTFHVDAEVRSGGDIVSARLIRPSAVTHQVDTEQRSVRLDITELDHGYDLSLPKKEGLTPDGPYMLFLVDDLGVPSEASWVQVG